MLLRFDSILLSQRRKPRYLLFLLLLILKKVTNFSKKQMFPLQNLLLAEGFIDFWKIF